MCDGEPRTQLVTTVNPFGDDDEDYSLCDAPECLEKLSNLTIGTGESEPVEDKQ